MSLRLRLLLALVALVAVGMLAADAATYVSLRSFLVNRVDEQLVAAQSPATQALIDAGNQLNEPRGGRDGPPTVLPSGTYVALFGSSGEIVNDAIVFSYGTSVLSVPSLPAGLMRDMFAAGGSHVLTADASGSSTQYRVLVTRQSGSDYALAVAIPLSDVTQTLGRLLVIEILVTVGVLLGLGLLAWFIVRREMRPLLDMAATAGAIAAGDLTQRVERAESRTEVGRLGIALNAMLGQIEEAFARRKASEDALRRFLAQASHELRTPLASIRGYAELFRRGAKDRPEDLELSMRRIEQEAARMGVLVEELLLLARLDEGMPLKRAPVDLAQIAADTVADAAITHPDRPVALEVPGPVVVPGDEARLRQVATNLVSNALQHAGDDARVHVSVAVCDGWVELEVGDDGVGMDAATAARAFEPFYRPADAGEGKNGESVGLGLAIAAGIVSAHGGSIDLRTAPGEGATFRVRLPLSAGTEDGELGEGAREHAPAAPSPSSS